MQQQHREPGGLPSARPHLPEEEALALHLDGALPLLHVRHAAACNACVQDHADEHWAACPVERKSHHREGRVQGSGKPPILPPTPGLALGSQNSRNKL